MKYVPGETQPLIDRYRVRTNDVFISIVGTIGRVAVIPQALDNAFLTENAARIITTQDVLDPHYLSYWLSSPMGQGAISRLVVGSTQPKLALSRIKQIRLPLPPFDEQRRIAEVLGALDDLIDANRRLIEGITLLALQCSLGPSGAEYRPLAELYEVGLSGVWGEDQASGSSSIRVAVLRGKDLEEIVSGQEASPPFRYLSQKQIDSRIPKLGEIWTAGSGSLGPSLLITDELADIVGWDTVLYSNFVKRLVPLVENDWYGVAWGAMVRAWRSGNFAGFRTGTAMPNLDPEAMLKGIQVPVLTVAERAEVNRLVSQALAPELRQEIAQLRRTRDELLPLLMSGAVRVRPEGVAA
jgi:hypothetical protein